MVSRVVIHFEGHSNLKFGFSKLFGNHIERARRRGRC